MAGVVVVVVVVFHQMIRDKSKYPTLIRVLTVLVREVLQDIRLILPIQSCPDGSQRYLQYS